MLNEIFPNEPSNTNWDAFGLAFAAEGNVALPRGTADVIRRRAEAPVAAEHSVKP